MRYRPIWVALLLLPSMAACDRAQQAALALSTQASDTPAATPVGNPNTARLAPSVASQEMDIGEWLEVAGERTRRSLATLNAQPSLSQDQIQLASALSTEVNTCAHSLAMRQAPGARLDVKRSMFEWSERQCARHLINQALLVSGPARAQEIAEVATLVDPNWSIPVVASAP